MDELSGHAARLQNSITRRAVLSIGGFGGLSFLTGLGTDTKLQAESSGLASAAKSIIFLSLYGGPPHQDTYDLKPHAPADIRGEFNPIATTLPGFQICEHLPKLSKLAHLYTIIRSVTHKDNGHESAFYALMTGWPYPLPNTNARPKPDDHPCYGTLVHYLQTTLQPVPGFVLVGGATSTGIGQNAGYLGTNWAPYFVRQDANNPNFRVDELTLREHVPTNRLSDRHRLLKQFDDLTGWSKTHARRGFSAHQKRAFEMLATPKTRKAFDIHSESPATRAAYGDHPFGQNLLLARRLVEAGVPIVQINWRNRGDGGFDTHSNNFKMCKDVLFPKFEGCLSALLIDLEERGLLDQTLVIAAGEFGRTPRINKNAGRDHWAGANSMLLAGGGIRRGFVYGSSNRTGAYPASNPVGPWDIVATLLHAIGIDPTAQFRDPQNGSRPICRGNVIEEVLA